MGLNATLITFNPATLIRAQDVNSNFTTLNNVASFNGGTATMSFEAGNVTSDGNGNIHLAAGKLGMNVSGDIIDGSSATDLYIKATGASGQIAFYIDSALTVAVTTSGLQMYQGGLVFGGLPNDASSKKSTKASTATVQTETGGPSSISRTSTFTGSATGTYNHGNNGVPDWVASICTSAGNYSGNNWDSPTTVTVHIFDNAALPFLSYVVGF